MPWRRNARRRSRPLRRLWRSRRRRHLRRADTNAGRRVSEPAVIKPVNGVARRRVAGVLMVALVAFVLAVVLYRESQDGAAAVTPLADATPASTASANSAAGSAPVDADYAALESALRNRSAASTKTPPPLVREDLRHQAEHNPRDGRAWALLAYAEFDAEAYAAAAAAFEKAAAVSAKVAADPGVLCDWADALGMAQGGALKGRPLELISRALALRPLHSKALEMAGSAAYEQRQFAMAADYWRRLLPQLAPRSEQQRALEQAIARAERLAATSLTPAR